MNELSMTLEDQSAFQKALDYTKDWCREHQWEVGAAEMALGAAAITWAVQNGVIDMGRDIVASAFSHGNLGEQIGGALGAGLGGVGGAILGSIGVVGMGSGIGIPAFVVIGGGSLLLGAAGYTVGDLTNKFLNPPVDPGEFFANASVLAVGVALLIDGARRVVSDKRVLALGPKIKDGVIYLSDLTARVVAKSMDELKSIMQSLTKAPEDAIDATGSVASGAGVAVAGTAIGGSLGAGSVSVLGSQAIGSVALSLGIVSAPVWPVIAGGVAGLALGYGAWKTVRHFGLQQNRLQRRY